jgi:hypothetical protein
MKLSNILDTVCVCPSGTEMPPIGGASACFPHLGDVTPRSPKVGDTVTYNSEGTLVTGTVFYSDPRKLFRTA